MERGVGGGWGDVCGYNQADRRSYRMRSQKSREQPDLIADVQGEEQHQHARGGVAAVMLGPVIVDVFEECRVEDLDLGHSENRTSHTNGAVRHRDLCVRASFTSRTNEVGGLAGPRPLQ